MCNEASHEALSTWFGSPLRRSALTSYTRALLKHRPAANTFLRPFLVAAALAAVLLLPAAGETKPQFAQAGEIEGVVTKAPDGAPVEGVEICAFDVAEDEEFTECAESKSNGAYEILGLDEGPYRVTFKAGESGLNLTTQYYRGASTPQAATIVRVNEGKATTGIDAAMQEVAGDDCPQSAAFRTTCPAVDFSPEYSITPGAIEVQVKSSARTPVAVTAPLPGRGMLKLEKTLAPGELSAFRLPISDGLGSRLRRLDSSRSLTLKLRARATKVKGNVSADRLSVRLPGRG